MKSIHIKKLERLRSINLRIGFAAAIFLAILAFNFTTNRFAPISFEDEDYPTEVALKPFAVTEPRTQEQPPATFLKPNDLIIEVPDLVVSSLLPILLPTDPNSVVGLELGNVQPTVAIIPKAPPLPPEEDDSKHIPFIIVEDMPRFPGCEAMNLSKSERTECATNRLLKFIYDNIRYPEMARNNGIEGSVYVKFVVARDIGGGCGDEALRVVGKMPKWLPGKQRGMAVRVQFSLPVKFKLGS